MLLFNCAAVGMWLWHFHHEREALKKVVVDSKFTCALDGWCLNEVYELHWVVITEKDREGIGVVY